jgi:phage-related protein
MNQPPQKIIPAAFYRTASGTEPVREWLKELDAEDRRIIGTDIRTVEFGWPVSIPMCRPLGLGLLEVRSTITKSRISRVLFCIHGERMVLLHGFIRRPEKLRETIWSPR